MTITEARQLQASINNGQCWLTEGAFGRAAMAALEAGDVMLGTEPQFDYWGNRVPARSEVKPGTKGSEALVLKAHGRRWADLLKAAD